MKFDYDLAVSVILPTYRRPRQLLSCLEALSVQTITDAWEVVIVDDGSSEPLLPSVENLVLSRGWKLVRQANAGPSAARNRGVREARGEFVAFTDDDCLPEPTWLFTLLKEARARPHSLVGGTTFNGLKEDFFAATSQLIIDFVYEHFNADPQNSYFLASNNILCSREAFQEIGGFDTSFPRAGAEDRDFCDRWRMLRKSIVWVPEALVEHRHGQTLRQFVNVHIRYGRGAYLYQSIRKRRASSSMRRDLVFHRSLPSRVLLHLKRSRSLSYSIATLMALFVWQLANAFGFFLEALMSVRVSAGNRFREVVCFKKPPS